MLSIAPSDASLEDRSDRFVVEALAGVLQPAWIHEAIVRSGRSAQRVRQLPAQLTLWTVILLGLFRRHSYVNLLGMLFETGRHRCLWARRGAPPCGSALTKARDRLGVKPVRDVFERSARNWIATTDGHMFHGRRVFAIDGTTLRLPDTPENEACFGRPPASRGHTSYPQLRMVTLRDTATRLVPAVRFGPYRRAEITLARNLVCDVESGSLVILDKNFLSYAFLWDLYASGVDFLVRGKSNIKTEVLEELGPGDAIVRVRLPRYLRHARPDLPREWILRRITYRPAAATEDFVLLTTLLLAEEIPAYELSGLYPERWEEETGYDELKTHLCDTTTITRPTSIRSRRPERVEQEVYGLLIAYNAMRITMALAAPRAETPHPLPARRLSFIYTLERMREAVRDMMQAATIRLVERFEQLLDSIARAVVPLRPGRNYPRAVKRKMSNYPLKTPQRAAPSG